MHGRVKSSVAPTEEEVERRQLKLNKYRSARDLLLQRHAQHLLDSKSYELTGLLIEINPDFYTIWNFRKQIVLHLIQQQSEQRETAAGQTGETHTLGLMQCVVVDALTDE